MNKKGEFGWEQIARILLVLLVIIILIGIGYLLKEHMIRLIGKIGDILRFG